MARPKASSQKKRGGSRARRNASAPSKANSRKPLKEATRSRGTRQASSGGKPTSTRTAGRQARARRSANQRTPDMVGTTGGRGGSPPLEEKRPSLERERRLLAEEADIPTPPSTLNLDRHASAARTGRRELKERLDEHTETGPALTGGDVDANWEEAASSGDEAPGGDNPTPDQGVVEDIGRSLGVEYEDNEELKSADKIAERDRHRWELDPASSDDYRDRTKKKI